jgi:hypothetical protein
VNATNGTNGHPFPLKPPVEMPPRPEPTRHLVIEVRDGNVVDTEEPTVELVTAWLWERGYAVEEVIPAKELGIGEPGRVIPELKAAIERARSRESVSLGSFAKSADDEPHDTEPPPTNVENEAPEAGQAGNPERDPRLVYREVELSPSERLQEIVRERCPAGVHFAAEAALFIVGAYLDEESRR